MLAGDVPYQIAPILITIAFRSMQSLSPSWPFPSHACLLARRCSCPLPCLALMPLRKGKAFIRLSPITIAVVIQDHIVKHHPYQCSGSALMLKLTHPSQTHPQPHLKSAHLSRASHIEQRTHLQLVRPKQWQRHFLCTQGLCERNGEEGVISIELSSHGCRRCGICPEGVGVCVGVGKGTF